MVRRKSWTDTKVKENPTLDYLHFISLSLQPCQDQVLESGDPGSRHLLIFQAWLSWLCKGERREQFSLRFSSIQSATFPFSNIPQPKPANIRARGETSVTACVSGSLSLRTTLFTFLSNLLSSLSTPRPPLPLFLPHYVSYSQDSTTRKNHVKTASDLKLQTQRPFSCFSLL